MTAAPAALGVPNRPVEGRNAPRLVGASACGNPSIRTRPNARGPGGCWPRSNQRFALAGYWMPAEAGASSSCSDGTGRKGMYSCQPSRNEKAT